jgi:hypothetical protein
MGTKRQIDEVESHDASGGHAAAGKRHKSYVGRKRPAQEDSGTKKRIRAIERSLRRNQDMPANVRIELERELASQKQILADKQYRRKRSAMISKYHHVRFFGASQDLQATGFFCCFLPFTNLTCSLFRTEKGFTAGEAAEAEAGAGKRRRRG